MLIDVEMRVQCRAYLCQLVYVTNTKFARSAMMHLFKNERNVILLGMFSLYTVLSLSQTPLDPCFMSATPSTGFASSANLLNVASSDLISWNGAGWTGS